MKPVNLLSFSDVHLGIRRLNADLMCNNLASFIFAQLVNVDMVTIVGDLFDTTIRFQDSSTSPIISFITKFLEICNERNILVRGLRGTITHDYNQMRILGELHQRKKYTNDYAYFDKIFLEYIERFDMRVLYIPDDVPFKSSVEAMEHVRDMMRVRGWDYVDYAFVHGYFDFVLPKTEKMDRRHVYTEEMFDFVRRRILVGHVHTPAVSPSGRIAYNGSTDRLSQGEEEVKGMILTEDDGGDKITMRFLANPKATTFRTFDYSHLDASEAVVNSLAEDIDALPVDNGALFVRVIHPSPEVRGALANFVEIHYPLVQFSHRGIKVPKHEDRYVSKGILPVDTNIPKPPTPDALPHLVMSQLQSSGRKTSLTQDRVAAMLEELKG